MSPQLYRIPCQPFQPPRRQVAGAVNLIIQQSRMKDGSRKSVQITQLQGMEGDQITLQDLFIYRTEGQTTGQAYSHAGGGQLEPTGYRPNFINQLEEYGFKLSAKIFGAGQKFNK